MIDIKDYILKEEIRKILEELNTDDNSLYILKKKTDKYNLYFHKHYSKQRDRHHGWNNERFISDKETFRIFDKAYNKIIDKYNSRQLVYSKNDKEAFAIIDKSRIDKLCIVGFINLLDKNTGKYEICLKTCIYKFGKDEFLLKNNKEYHTVPVILEQLKEEFNLILVYNE